MKFSIDLKLLKFKEIINGSKVSKVSLFARKDWTVCYGNPTQASLNPDDFGNHWKVVRHLSLHNHGSPYMRIVFMSRISSMLYTYLATLLPPSLLTIGDHLLYTSLSFSSILICFVHCVWPSYRSVLSTLWCCQTMISYVCLFSFFLQPCLLQSVE